MTKRSPTPKRDSVFEISQHRFQRGQRELVILELLFRDPETRNSFSVENALELGRILKAHAKVDGLLLRAEGRVFCSGGNLKDHLRLGKTKSLKANRDITKVLSQLEQFEAPTVVLVEGDVFGGGLEWLSAFDLVFATPHTHLGFWQRKMGLIYGWGGGARLAKRVGAKATSRFGIEMKSLTGREAFACGLVDRIVAPWSARPEALAEVLRLASLPRRSVAAFKRADDVKSEQREFAKLWFGPDHQDRLAQFTVHEREDQLNTKELQRKRREAKKRP